MSLASNSSHGVECLLEESYITTTKSKSPTAVVVPHGESHPLLMTAVAVPNSGEDAATQSTQSLTMLDDLSDDEDDDILVSNSASKRQSPLLDEDDEDDLTDNENTSTSLLQGAAAMKSATNTTSEENDDDDVEAELSWRLDPIKSLSDWTIQVIIRGTPAVHQTYHVHKSVLAIGPRRSNYFAQSFQKKQQQAAAAALKKPKPAQPAQQQHQLIRSDWDCMSSLGGGDGSRIVLMEPAVETTTSQAESQPQNVSRLELHRLAIDAFPVLLDYMYSHSGNLAITTQNATALHALAFHLEIKALRAKVKAFWLDDVNMNNLCVYYQHARVFKDRRILSFCEEYCAGHVFEVEESVVVDILTTVDPLFFLNVITLPAIGGNKKPTSLRLSLLVAVYCNIHKAELDPPLFLRLTAAAHLPHLEVKAARALLEMEDDIIGLDSRHEMTSLKQRSIAVLSDQWDVACLVAVEGTASVASGSTTTAAANRCTSPTDLRNVTLPRLFHEPLEIFTSMALLNAKQRLDRMEQQTFSRQEHLEAELVAAHKKIAELQVQLKNQQ